MLYTIIHGEPLIDMVSGRFQTPVRARMSEAVLRMRARDPVLAGSQIIHFNKKQCGKSSLLTGGIFSNNETIPSDIWPIGKELMALIELSTWLASFQDFFIHLRHYAASRIQLLISNDRNRVRLSSVRSLTGWNVHGFVWKVQRELLKARPMEWYPFQSTSFLIGQYF